MKIGTDEAGQRWAVEPGQSPVRISETEYQRNKNIKEQNRDLGTAGRIAVKAGQHVKGILSNFPEISALEGTRFSTGGVDPAARQGLDQMSEDYPISSTVGAMAPYTVPMGGPVRGLAGAATAAGIGGATGALDVEAGGTAQSRGLLGAAGGVVGHGIGRGVSRMLGRNKLTQAPRNTIARDFTNRGGSLLPSQAGGKFKGLKARYESVLDKNLLAGPSMDVVGDRNLRMLHRKAARAIGEQAQEVSQELIDNAHSRIGAVYDDVAQSMGTMDMPESFWDAVEDLGPGISSNVRRKFTAGQPVSGDVLGLIRSEASAAKKVPAHVKTAPKVIEEYMDMLEQTAPGKKAGLKVANRQYKNLKAVESAWTGTELNFKTLRNRLQKSYGKRGIKGDKATEDLYEFARLAGSKDLSPRVGNSGTAERGQSIVAGVPQGLMGRTYLNEAKGVPSKVATRAARQASAGLLTQLSGEFDPSNVYGIDFD